ncbi:zinc metallopeptidase RseP, partial [Erwinia amylovora]|nr:zinc metallopeptidase RseP [Erwinia amylovora]
IGVPGVRPVIGEIISGSPAAEAQITPGTDLKAVDGIETPDWDAVRMALVARMGEEETRLTLAPCGSEQTSEKSIDLRHWQFEP